MPTVLIRGNVVSSGVEFELRGFANGAVTEVFVEEAILGQAAQVPISGVGGEAEPPPPVLSARIVNAPVSAQESTTITTLEAELVDENLDVVELYDAANWTWAVDSGGGSFGGVDNDELTLPAAPATVAVSATHKTESVVATAVISVVATVTFTADFFNLPGQIIEGRQSSPLRSRVLASDGTTAEQIQTNFSYSIVSGPGSIGGTTGDNVLIVDAASAGSMITVRATYTGSLNVSPATDDQTTSVVAEPAPGDFPDNEPANMTQLTSVDCTSKDFGAGWNPSNGWDNNLDRLEVVSDLTAKHDFAIQKNFFIGDPSGWNGALNVFGHNPRKEVYMRVIYKLSSNWDSHDGGGDKIWVSSGNRILIEHLQWNRTPFFWNWITDLPLALRIWRPIIPGSPEFTGGAGFSNGPFPVLDYDEYHTVEVWKRMNDPGVANGGFRVWIDDIEYTRFSVFGAGQHPEFKDFEPNGNVQFTTSTGDTSITNVSTAMEIPLFWGGQQDTKEANDFVRLSEVYISGRS